MSNSSTLSRPVPVTGQSRLAEHFIQSFSIKQLPALYYGGNSLGIMNVVQRVGLKKDEVASRTYPIQPSKSRHATP